MSGNIIFVNSSPKGKVKLTGHFPGILMTKNIFSVPRNKIIPIEKVAPSLDTMNSTGAYKLINKKNNEHVGYVSAGGMNNLYFFNLAGELVASLEEYEGMANELLEKGILLTDKKGTKVTWEQYPRVPSYNGYGIKFSGEGEHLKIIRVIKIEDQKKGIGQLGLDESGPIKCRLGKREIELLPEQFMPDIEVKKFDNGFTVYKKVEKFGRDADYAISLVDGKGKQVGQVAKLYGALIFFAGFSGLPVAEIKKEFVGDFDVHKEKLILIDKNGKEIRSVQKKDPFSIQIDITPFKTYRDFF